MNFKKCVLLCIFLFLIFVSYGQTKKKVTIGAVFDGYWKGNEESLQQFKKEIFDLLGNEYDVDFSKENIISGNWTVPSAIAAVDRLLNDSKIDIVLSLGMMASDNVCKRTNLPKPVIAPFIMDADVQGMPKKGRGSGVKNLNYLVSLRTVRECFEYFKKIVDFDRVVFLTPGFVRDAIPEAMKWGEMFLKDTGIRMETLWVDESYEDVISKLRPDMQAIFITPILHIPREEFKKIIAAVNRLKIPSFSHVGDTNMEDGALATIHKRLDFSRLARRVALNIQRILMGEDAGTLPVEFKSEIQLTINMKTARQIGVYPTWDVTDEAELLYEEEEAGEPLVFMDAINRAIKSNLELLSKQTEFRAAKQDVRLAAAKLLPRFDISLTGAKIDEDRAASGFGMFAENTLYGSAVLTQLIYSEPALANVSIQKHLQRSREAEMDQVTLDIALMAAEAYINVLRAKALERVQKNNLKKTQANLELARIRQSLGVSGPSEIYRWDAQYAGSQKDLVDAKTQREIAEIHLNRVIHHPQGERFSITDAGLASPFLKSRDSRLFDSINNPWIYKVFLEFWVGIGMKNSPELNRIDAAIAAKKRYLKSSRYKFYFPTIALQAGVDNYFSKTGKGTENSDMSNIYPAFNMAQLEALGSLLPTKPNDLDWNIGLKLSFNLFSGGEKIAEHKKIKLELEKLETDRNVLVEMLEQTIRTRYRIAGTSITKMTLSRRASEAAAKTLEMVTDAYSRGAVSILDLIDAQGVALAADRAAANALYDFLVNMFRAQRSVNRLDFLTKTDEQMLMLDKFEAFLAKKGITLRKRQ